MGMVIHSPVCGLLHPDCKVDDFKFIEENVEEEKFRRSFKTLS